MMLYFHEGSRYFSHTGVQPLFWGNNEDFVEGRGETSRFDFKMCERKNQIGPLIGILTGKNKAGLLTGNGSLFKSIQAELQEIGGFSFVFTLDDLFPQGIHGYFHHPSTDTWHETDFPYPEIIYNRLPSRKTEESESFHHLIKTLKEKEVPFFNPCFINKLDMYESFKNIPSISKHLPFTAPLMEKSALLALLEEKRNLYIKPIKQSQGKGITLLTMDESGEWRLVKEKDTARFSSFDSLWECEGDKWLAEPYLMQEMIQTKQAAGKKYDLRGHVHFGKKGYTLTGIGVRLANKQQLTTHMKRGGSLYPYHSIRNPLLETEIKSLAKHCGKALSDLYGFFGEFTFDLGLDERNHIWLFELNSKPMSFDEEEIELKKRSSIVRLFYQLTHWV
ncbi:YheC/YheD family protein [Falsibacillus pallidus]|uniref:YheC/D-like protein n=1 Tax=Falsibacillus pallidus TaxID=493781 RepID=A0A370GWG4_9BACI|nr:YheC/YheD family protein [Falsibacillus pallidus]RDI47891.1 YheC/D-like protein [Falsibacillus pallidus]